jgi:hypothetical protein
MIRTARFLAFLLTLAAIGLFIRPAPAAVVVLASRTERPVKFTLQPAQGKAESWSLEPGELITVPVAGEVELTLAAEKPRRYKLTPNTPYYFVSSEEGVSLHEVGIGDRPAPPAKSVIQPTGKLTIAVKLLVDDDEPAARQVWEARLRKRLEAASDILERHCRVRFEVVAVETWESDNQTTEFLKSLEEFERKVKLDRARLAIGFTSQYHEPQRSTHLGVTRAVLHTHILLREWYPRNEPERLEVLVHELGHFLGASHSPEPISVMRPKLGDGRATVQKFRIGFDPLNALIMCLVAEEVQTRGSRSFNDLSPAAREQIGAIYIEIARALPNDPAAGELARRLRRVPAEAEPQIEAASPIAEGTRLVVAAVVRAAEQNLRLPPRAEAAPGRPHRLAGDALTEQYVREAALAARQLPDKLAVPAFLMGIGIALDSADALHKNPATRVFCRNIESEDDRRHRLEVLGLPTMRGRHDLLQHFVVSGALVVLVGPTLAEAAGILKEQMDMQAGGSGLSFADLCADFAGIAFARQLRKTGSVPAELAKSFTVADYMPDITGLREGLSQEAFGRAFGSVSDERFLEEQAAISKRIQALPGYQPR